MVDRSFHGTDVAVWSLPPTAIVTDTQSRLVTLISTWYTDNASQIINDEAYRRILESFTEFMQRNALQETQRGMVQFGTNTGTWEPAYQSIWSAALTGWTYIDSIRHTADSLITAPPVDPTDDGNWPARIPSVYIPPL